MAMTQAASVEDYIAGFPEATQTLLKKFREVISKAAPKAEESISYGMPAYKLHGPLVYFGAFKNHIGLYPTGSNMTELAEEISLYKTSKGTLQFPLDKAMPWKLIEKVVKFRVKENEEKAMMKKKK